MNPARQQKVLDLFSAKLLVMLILALHQPTLLASDNARNAKREPIHALYIPLADHYPAIVAYERYRHEMQQADFRIEQMKNWDLLRAYFQSGEVDMAFITSPLAMDMFRQKPDFRWIGLIHRDGSALAINDNMNELVKLPKRRQDRKPDASVAQALKDFKRQSGKPTEIGMPHLLASHNVVLYRYLKQYNLSLSLKPNDPADVLAIAVAPPKSPAFIHSKSNRSQPAAFEQSLPWADIVESTGFGKVAWYSKDVMPWKHGHVECITVATDSAIKNKFEALQEVMFYIRKAAQDIETARTEGGEKLHAIVSSIRKHIPAHTREAIIASLDPNLRVINYENLNIDKNGLKQIMDLAVESGILISPIDINLFADTRFDLETGALHE